MRIPSATSITAALTALVATGLIAAASLLAAVPMRAQSKPASAGMTSPPVAASPAPRALSKTRDDATAQSEELREANLVLSRLAKTYRYLDGVTLRIGATPDGDEAVAYYTDGEIVISPRHVVGLDDILSHEIWHIIDWRDNGRIDWTENLPPRNASDYRRRR